MRISDWSSDVCSSDLALPLLWIGSGLGAWLLGDAGSHHLGASGLGHGLLFLVFVLGLLRRDRASIATAMIAVFLYGGMLLTVLPRELDVSWQSHLGGAVAGVAAAFAFRRKDPQAPRRRYSWEIEEEQAALDAQAAAAERDQFERSEEHTSELQSLMRISYAVFCLKNKK